MRLLVISSVVFFDQLTKFFAYQALPDKVIAIFPYLSLRLFKNTGIVFGWLQGMNTVLIFVVALIIVGLLVVRVYGRFNNLMFSFIIGGGMGNLIDRIFRGGVIDFIHLEFWTIFNIADVAITVGVIGLFVSSFRTRKEKVQLSS